MAVWRLCGPFEILHIYREIQIAFFIFPYLMPAGIQGRRLTISFERFCRETGPFFASFSDMLKSANTLCRELYSVPVVYDK